MQNFSPAKWLTQLLVLVVASVVFCVYFRGLMLDPNQRAPTFGGDGLTIHYNLQYHAKHGDGAWLTSQYHPHRESVFMTDAHALIAVALAELRPYFPNLHQYSAGISGGLIFWSNPLSVLLLFLIMRRIGVRWWLGMLTALLIGMMSPQILRQLGGQYTLGFTFLLPLTIYYQLSFGKGKGYWPKSVAMATVIVLIGLNNPYMFAVAGGQLLGAAGVGVLLRVFPKTRLPWAQLIAWGLVALASAAVIFTVLARYDEVADRVEVPFGFFKNIASWGGLLTEPGSVIYPAMKGLFPKLKTPFQEDKLYLGIVPILAILVLFVSLFVKRWRKTWTAEATPTLRVLAVGVLPGLIFAFALPFAWFADWTYAHLGSILQFRAPVRFGWPVYYLAGILAAFALERWWEHKRDSKLKYLVALPLVLWSTEAHQFLTAHLDDHNHGSALKPEKIDQQQRLAEDLGIDTTTFSSIYLLPTENGWSDKIHQDGSWRSNHDGYQFSIATGLPLLNGKLSRISLNWVLRSLQIVSHPLIERPLLGEIDNDKAILLLKSNENPISDREASVLALADTLHSDERLLLACLPPERLRTFHREALAAARADTTAGPPLLRYAYEDNTAHAYVGSGSRRVKGVWTDLLSFPAGALQAETEYELSAWVWADGSRFGGPKFFLRHLDADGNKLREDAHWINRTYDAQNDWLRTRINFKPEPGAERFLLVSEYEFSFWLDEVWVLAADIDARAITSDGTLYNNFLLR